MQIDSGLVMSTVPPSSLRFSVDIRWPFVEPEARVFIGKSQAAGLGRKTTFFGDRNSKFSKLSAAFPVLLRLKISLSCACFLSRTLPLP